MAGITAASAPVMPEAMLRCRSESCLGWAMIFVIVGWSGIGVWLMITRDA
jgi:hypothetical protein